MTKNFIVSASASSNDFFLVHRSRFPSCEMKQLPLLLPLPLSEIKQLPLMLPFVYDHGFDIFIPFSCLKCKNRFLIRGKSKKIESWAVHLSRLFDNR